MHECMGQKTKKCTHLLVRLGRKAIPYEELASFRERFDIRLFTHQNSSEDNLSIAYYNAVQPVLERSELERESLRIQIRQI